MWLTSNLTSNVWCLLSYLSIVQYFLDSKYLITKATYKILVFLFFSIFCVRHSWNLCKLDQVKYCCVHNIVTGLKQDTCSRHSYGVKDFIWKLNVFSLMVHYVESARIGSFSGPYFSVFELNTNRYEISVRVQSKCGKIRTRKTPNLDTFHVVVLSSLACCTRNTTIWLQELEQL